MLSSALEQEIDLLLERTKMDMNVEIRNEHKRGAFSPGIRETVKWENGKEIQSVHASLLCFVGKGCHSIRIASVESRHQRNLILKEPKSLWGR